MKFQPPKGTRDLLPEDSIKLQKVLETVRVVFEKFGFYPITTPAFENFELFTAKGGLGQTVKDEIYYFKDKSDRELGLRFDLTMPLSRVVTSNSFTLPFKRYAIEKVWRYDNPQAMRWMEFWQADVDVVGSKSMLADAECLAVAVECLKKLGFEDFTIRVNNRKVLESVLGKYVPKEKIIPVFRTIDKLDKIGETGVKRDLLYMKINPNEILQSVKVSGTNEEILSELENEYGDTEGVKELKELFDYAGIFGIENRLKIDLSLVRGLEYYTSVVFEISLGAAVSCGGGGRYDRLMKSVGGKDLPATGISLGIDRILEVVKEEEMFGSKKTPTKIFVANVNEETKNDAIKIAVRLRAENLQCETDLMGRNLTKQLEYADAMEIPYVLVVGGEEVKKQQFKLKDMRNKTEKTLGLDEIKKSLNREEGA